MEKRRYNAITIKEIRIKLGMTQKEMSEELGITRTGYWYKETGRRSFKVNEIIKICKMAGVNPLELTL